MAVTDEELRKIYRFDEFQIDARRRVLQRNGKALTLNSKAFDLLLVLVTSGGRELSKDQLMQLVWPDQIVEENNLAVHIYTLRKLLGERKDEHRYIITIPGVGYRFVADVNDPETEADEVFIESHSVSRVVVEEESALEQTAEHHGALVNSSNQGVMNAARTVNGEVVYPAKELQAAPSTAPSTAIAPLQTFNRKPILLLVALAGLVLAAGLSAYWFYGNRLPAANSATNAARQQMTITRVTHGKHIGCPSISPDGKFIASIENASTGAGTLFVQQTDTNTVLQLLEPADRTFGCTNFSPDGSLIYYVVFDKRDPDAALYSVPVLGGTPKRIMGNCGSCFSLSPDGKRVAFYRGDGQNNRNHLMISALDGSGERALLTRNRDEWSHGLGLAWSPDGNLIAMFANMELKNPESRLTIYGVDAHNGAVKSLTAEQFSGIGKMSWASDGRSLVFVGKRPRSENQLYQMDYPSGVVRPITNDLESYGNYGLGITADSSTLVANISERNSEIWSIPANGDASKEVLVTSGATNGEFGITSLPGGRIAYIGRTGKNLDIWTAGEDGRDKKALTTDAITQRDVVASPDGRYLVFAADSAGKHHIFRMKADDGSEITQLTFGDTSNTLPDISPDGVWVVYGSWNGKQSTLWKVPLAGGASQQLTDYESGAPIFAPDGKSIACILPSTSRATLASIAIVPADGGKPVKSFQVIPFAYAYSSFRWSPDGKALVLKKSTNGVSDLWQQPLSGEAPQRLTNFQSGAIWNFAYSRDGKRIFVSRGATFVDVVLIKNFR